MGSEIPGVQGICILHWTKPVWNPVSFDNKYGQRLHEKSRRRPADVSLLPPIFLLPWGISASREHGAFCFSTVYKLKVGKFVQFWLWLLLRVKGYKNHQQDLESELFSFQPFQSICKHFSQNHSACRLAAMIWFRMAKGNGVSRFLFPFFPS